MTAHHTPPPVVRPHIPTLWADGKHDDAPALQAYFDGTRVYIRPEAWDCTRLAGSLTCGVYRLNESVRVSKPNAKINFAMLISDRRVQLSIVGDNFEVIGNFFNGVVLCVGRCSK